jgi:mannose-6-phosphate isomerase-like protein (cupin superfamily)
VLALADRVAAPLATGTSDNHNPNLHQPACRHHSRPVTSREADRGCVHGLVPTPFYAELMSFFSRYEEPGAGFRTVAGPEQGLTGFLVASGRLAAGEGGPPHLHHGDEVLRILSGELEVTVGDQVRLCGAGDIVAVPADTLHGFRTITEVRLEVVAVRDAGQVFPVYLADGSRQLTEVYRQDMPWSRTPPAGFGWTTDEQMADVLRNATPPDHGH